MEVVEATKIEFRCKSCKSLNRGDEDEFQRQDTMPPSWLACCAFCKSINVTYPSPLIAKAANEDVDRVLGEPVIGRKTFKTKAWVIK